MEAPPSPKAVVYSLDSPSFSPRWSNPSPIPAVSLGSIPVAPAVPVVPVADAETKEEKTAVMSEVKLSEANSNSNSNSNDSVEMKDETVETQSGTMDASKPSDSNENGGNSGNSGNSGNGEEPKPELAKEESEKSEKSEKPVPAMVETVEPENHRIEIKLPGSSSNTPEAGEDSELPAEEETEEAEESEEAEEVLIPYDISLLHQILSFLIQLADPTKCV